MINEGVSVAIGLQGDDLGAPLWVGTLFSVAGPLAVEAKVAAGSLPLSLDRKAEDVKAGSGGRLPKTKGPKAGGVDPPPKVSIERFL